MNKERNFLQSKFMLTIYSILISFVVGAIFLVVMGISPATAYAKLLDELPTTQPDEDAPGCGYFTIWGGF